MNLPNLVGCLLLLWLPSAHLVNSPAEIHFGKTRGSVTGVGVHYDGEKRNVEHPQVIKATDHTARNSSKTIATTKSATAPSKALTYASIEKYYIQKSAKKRLKRNSLRERENAHKLVDRLGKRSSALIFDNNIRNDIRGNSGDTGRGGGRGGGKGRNRGRGRGSKRSAVRLDVTRSDRWKRGSEAKVLAVATQATSTTTTMAATTAGTIKPETTTAKTTSSNAVKFQVTTPIEEYEDDTNDGKETNVTHELGSILGGPCESSCSEKLLHVFCEPTKKICQCIDKYPVQIGIERGCEKPKQLGDQCFYEETCSFFDSNAICRQIDHNAICQCKSGFHTVALRKGVKRMFCSEDIVVVSADLPTLLGVATGIALLTGLLCFVLRLFSGNRYPATRHYGNANLTPPLLFSSDNQWVNGIPLTVQGRPSSRSSCQRSTTSLAQYPRNKGVMVPASRAGAARVAAILLIPCHLQESRQTDSEVDTEEVHIRETDVEPFSRIGSRRHSLTSVHSTTSSQKSMSYSARRFEQENQQREQRAAMRASREEAARLAALPTPSASSTEDVLLINTSTTNEEDFLCSSTTDAPAQSEPPALLFNMGNVEGSKTSKTNPIIRNK